MTVITESQAQARERTGSSRFSRRGLSSSRSSRGTGSSSSRASPGSSASTPWTSPARCPSRCSRRASPSRTRSSSAATRSTSIRAVGQIIVMIDRGRRRELRALRRAARGRLPAAARARGVRRTPLAPSRLRPEAGTAYFASESREESLITAYRVDLASGEVEALGESAVRRVRRRLEPRPLAGDPRGRLHGRRHGPLRARRRRRRGECSTGRRSTSASEGGEYPPHGVALAPLRGERERAPARVRASSRTRAPSATSTSSGRARSSRSLIEGIRARRSRRARGAHAPGGRPLRAPLQHRRLLVGVRGPVRRARAAPDGRARARRRGRARRGCPARSPLRRGERPVRALLLHGDAAHAALRARRRGRRRRHRRRASARSASLPSALGRRGRVIRVARRPPGLGAALPAGGRARLRGAEAARLLRPRRSAGSGAAELRLVLDAAHPDPHARGLCGVRPQRARLERLRAQLHEARRPRLGRAGHARPRPRDDRGAAEGRARRRRACGSRRALVRRLHDADVGRPVSGASGRAQWTCSARTT